MKVNISWRKHVGNAAKGFWRSLKYKLYMFSTPCVHTLSSWALSSSEWACSALLFLCKPSSSPPTWERANPTFSKPSFFFFLMTDWQKVNGNVQWALGMNARLTLSALNVRVPSWQPGDPERWDCPLLWQSHSAWYTHTKCISYVR